MKTRLLCLVSILFLTVSQAQVTQLVADLNFPQRLKVKDNYVYFTDENSVQRFDYTENPITIEFLVGGLNSPAGLEFEHDELYIAEFFGGRILKINVNDQTPTLEEVVTGLNTPNSIAISGDYLYYSDNNSDIIARVSLTDPNPTSETILSQAGIPSGITINGDFLYYALSFTNDIKKIDITHPNPTVIPVIENLGFPLGINFRGDELFISREADNIISKYDINTATLADVLTDLDGPIDVTLNNSTLFFINFNDSSINKSDYALGINTFDANKAIQVYPNPTDNFLRVSNLGEEMGYAVYSLEGIKISFGILQPNGEISVENISAGLYLLKLENGQALKFVVK